MSGPRRRAAVARAVQDGRAGLVVRAVPGGWTVATRTGRTRVARTLDELLDAANSSGRSADDRAGLRDRALAAADGL
ncbi:hypothetical protein [Pseudonocardia endophytica]|uniref:hypothetical protein n=1 Tax=Pseudonocardia endophytica TaxID=401976 RepID=UPI00104E60FA|nr:hypothetical protein [Pseudonocardia endophytica]